MLEKKIKFKSGKVGSALIMTVVLTVLLAIVAVTFVLVARMDSAATSNISDSKSLDNAAKSIIEIIGKELVLDMPGIAGQEYQDYPDANDPWLASIEPYKNDANEYEWRQISDVTGYLKSRNFERQNISVKPSGSKKVVKEYPEIEVEMTAGQLQLKDTTVNANADADGDGIADSKWIELTDIRSSKGKPVYAAVRVIDNCAMLNLNTAYVFDSNSGRREEVDGTSQLQINLKGLLKPGDDIDDFHTTRCGGIPASWGSYENSVIWNYGVPGGTYMPFDISDELELRYRYCIDSRFESRLEDDVDAMPETIRGDGTPDFGNLYDGYSSTSTHFRLDDWQSRITEPDYNDAPDRRHLLTAYNFDSIIAPDGKKMFNVKTGGDAQRLYERLLGCINPDLSNSGKNEVSAELAQIAANIVDRSDNDSNVTVVSDANLSPKDFYGYESPFIFISEVARNFYQPSTMNPPSTPSTDANIYRSYAIELYKNYDSNSYFEPWWLEISGISGSAGPTRIIDVNVNDFNDRGGEYYVIIFEDANAPLADQVAYTDSPKDGAIKVDPNVTLRWPQFLMGFDPNGVPIMSSSYDLYYGTDEGDVNDANGVAPTGGEYVSLLSNRYKPEPPAPGFDPNTTYYWKVVGWKAGFSDISSPVYSFTTWKDEPNDVYETITAGEFVFDSNTAIKLYRPIKGSRILVDDINLPGWFTDIAKNSGIVTYQRNMQWSMYLKRIWYTAGEMGSSISSPRLGSVNLLIPKGKEIPPWHNSFTNIGDAAMVFCKNTYLTINSIMKLNNYLLKETDVRFDVEDANMQNVFKYITAFDPDGHWTNDANEMRVRGRLNINTAPKFVIAQLPWVSKVNHHDLNIADAIVAYRDKLDISADGGPDYYHNREINAREQETDIDNISESPGFKSIGELMNVINDSGKEDYDIRYCGIDGRAQYRYPDLTFGSISGTDDVQDDLEEEELIFARISDLATVRSDVFTAYILVRLGVDGPQKRFIVIFDRSGVSPANDKVSVAAFQQVPPAR
jgi:hypothetical protein